jgi:hypothetical protein
MDYLEICISGSLAPCRHLSFSLFNSTKYYATKDGGVPSNANDEHLTGCAGT